MLKIWLETNFILFCCTLPLLILIRESGNTAGAPELHYVVFEPGVKHWHGGSADSEFAHIAINTNPELAGLQWFERISDEEYGMLSDTH